MLNFQEEIEPDETEGGQQMSASGIKDDEAGDHLSELLNGKKEVNLCWCYSSLNSFACILNETFYLKGQFGCGFLFKRINYTAYRVAMEKGEAPFAAFYPHDRDNVYLFRVMQAGEKHVSFITFII